ncbi:MAG: hypothetical protein M1834_004869 [Cirrosporium novae-zelandiae]|nr:MAG: hypothetical protein M1834_004869 [Cirrosporium novae-zelandiae]
MADQSILRISREVRDIQKTTDLSIAVGVRDADMRHVKALIIGPPDTPYEFGFFEFSVKFLKDYPGKAPIVTAMTTNNGRTRFNPNIYAQGKVCLSILGTWRGERGEQWSSAQGLESILISIQSLMSSNPYENEPGFENAKSSSDRKNMASYTAKIQHETLRIAVIERLEESLGILPDGTIDYTLSKEYEADSDEPLNLPAFEPFKDLCKRRFLWYYDSYMRTIDSAEKKVGVNEAFQRMPFEGSGNAMEGIFNYPELRRRLNTINMAIHQETERWATEGAVAAATDKGVASNLKRQYEQIVESYKQNDLVTLDLELDQGNPFVWILTYFGRPMTHLDGGMFRIRISLSTRFPEEQPRVKFETQMFHHRISPAGVLCYFAKRPEDMKSHIEGIVDSLEDEAPPYDPRTLVNPEASKLFWGSAEDKKAYNKKLRRAVQRSLEG